MIDLPTTLAEVDQLIKDQVQEDINLDYKDSRALFEKGNSINRNEIAKDVSAFANSGGGMLIYGVQETKNLPVRVDGGVELALITRERLEQVINSNITPRIDNLRIVQIPVSATNFIYVVQVPKSYRAPHQEKNTKKYYKRYNFESVAMEDYEINDIRSRRRIVPPLVNVDVETKDLAVFLQVSNIGEVPAQDVTFQFSEKLVWHNDEPTPQMLATGVKYFAPGKTFLFFYHTFPELFAEGSLISSRFDVTVSYLHPEIGQRISDDFHLDFRDYLGSSGIPSDVSQLTMTLKESIAALTKQVTTLNQHFEHLSAVAGPTGLDLSVSALRNVRHLLAQEDEIEKIAPDFIKLSVYREVLGVDNTMASELQNFFHNLSLLKSGYQLSQKPKMHLSEIEGMTEELAEKVRKYFRWDGDI